MNLWKLFFCRLHNVTIPCKVVFIRISCTERYLMKKITIFAVLIAALMIVSCGSKKAASGSAMVIQKSAEAPARVNMKMMSDSASFDEAVVEEAEYGAANGQNADTINRKLVYTGNVTVQVSDLDQTEKSVRDWAAKYGGYVASSSFSDRNYYTMVKIPSQNFQFAMDEVSSFGSVKNRSISTEDVTEQYFDVSTRLETRKILRDRLQKYLSDAKDMKDLLAVESELNNVQSDVEVMEGQFRRLSDRIDYATVHLTAVLPYNSTEQGFIYPDMGSKMRELWSDTVNFLADFVMFILYVVIYGIPILALVAFLYWLCFGRIGLLRRFFKFLSKKKQ